MLNLHQPPQLPYTIAARYMIFLYSSTAISVKSAVQHFSQSKLNEKGYLPMAD